MNHIEALRICRDALQDVAEKVLVWPEDRAKQAFIDTAVIDPVAASIDGPELVELTHDWSRGYESAPGSASEENAWRALVQHIDQHCAAQVAQAGSAARHEAENADEWRVRALAAEKALAVKPAPTDRDGRMSDQMREMIAGMSVSMDVSTGEDDAEHRYFGTVSEVMDCDSEKHGVIILACDAVPSFAVRPAPMTDRQIVDLFDGLLTAKLQVRKQDDWRDLQVVDTGNVWVTEDIILFARALLAR